MSITATNTAPKRELIPAGNYIARCYQMIHIGTIEEDFAGEKKLLNKVRIGWELPTELKVFNKEKGEQPCVISKTYTLSLNEKANLRKMLASWRGVDFTEEQAKSFDVTKLLGVPCMLNLIHKPSKDGSVMYEEIGSISAMPKGIPCPDQVNATQELNYENFDFDFYNKLPDFLKAMIQGSKEFKALNHIDVDVSNDTESGEQHEAIEKIPVYDTEGNLLPEDDLPF